MIELDLNEILEGTHTDLFTVGQVTGQCSCGEYVGQDQYICVHCQEEIVWKGSKTYNKYILSAEDNIYPSATRFLKRVRVTKFKDGREFHRWSKISQVVWEATVRDTIDYCRNDLRKKDGKATGRAVMQYTLRLLEKKLPEETVEEGTVLGRVGDPD